MPDITMCTDESCPVKEKCWRHEAPPSEFRQSYFCESPRLEETCEYFMQMRKRDA